MLDMDLDLEADLGIDTVKQAELFAMIRTNYGIPRKEDLRLSDYNTLTRVVGFVADALSAGPQSSSPATVATPIPAGKPAEVQTVEPEPVLVDRSFQPYQGLLFLSADTVTELTSQVNQTLADAKNDRLPESVCPSPQALAKLERLAIDYADNAELVKKLEKVSAALTSEKSGMWSALQGQGVYRGSGKRGKMAFMFPGQGSQYVNMLKDLHETEPVVVETFEEADRVMTPIFGKPLTSYIYVDGDEESIAQAEKNLKRHHHHPAGDVDCQCGFVAGVTKIRDQTGRGDRTQPWRVCRPGGSRSAQLPGSASSSQRAWAGNGESQHGG